MTSPGPRHGRYAGLSVATHVGADGRAVVHLARRFVPPPEAFTTVTEHAVIEGDRLDLIAARYLGDPTLFWRLCDANRALDPAELVAVVGRRLRITLPSELSAGPGGDDHA